MRLSSKFLIITLTVTLPFTGCNLGDKLEEQLNQKPEVDAASEVLKTAIPPPSSTSSFSLLKR